MISPGKRGRLIEQKAEILFLEAGFEVFTNCTPDGPADFIVWDGSTCFPIDTKKLSEYVRKDGTVGFSIPLNQVDGVHYLGHYSQGWVWLNEVPDQLNIL